MINIVVLYNMYNLDMYRSLTYVALHKNRQLCIDLSVGGCSCNAALLGHYVLVGVLRDPLIEMDLAYAIH